MARLSRCVATPTWQVDRHSRTTYGEIASWLTNRFEPSSTGFDRGRFKLFRVWGFYLQSARA